MARRDPRPRARRAAGSGAVALTTLAALVSASISTPLGRAQPAPSSDISRAKDLYKSAEAAMKDGRYDDATRDYGAAYELSKDPALFFKIARANERAGKCDVALIYYARYLREGNPSEQFVAATKERIAACGGDVHAHDGGAAGNAGSGSAAPVSAGSGSAAPVSAGSDSAAPVSAGSDSAAGNPGSGSATPVSAGTAPAAGNAGGGSAAPVSAGSGPATGSADVAAGTGSGSPALVLTPSNSDKAAWILGGGAIALITLGGVLAYASSSSENDIRDLYVGFAGQPATFDSQTQQKYNDLIDQGRRYQHLSWAAFGLAGAAAVGAAVLFVIGGRDEPAHHARVTPQVTTNSAGVAVTF
jgi:hypothetical protein